MKISRLETLYRQKLVPPTEAGKTLPLEQILKKPLLFYPSEPTTPQYDILEIGPGRGDFLFALCEQNPTQSIVAVEIGKLRFDKLIEQSQKKNLKNVTLIYGDARIPVEKHFVDAGFSKVFVLFPDPWPRNKHRHKRLLQVDFLKKLAQKIKVGGEFLLVTDVADYAEWSFENLKTLPEFHTSQTVPLPGLPPDVIPTFFAEKWQKMGRNFWSVRFIKNWKLHSVKVSLRNMKVTAA